MKLNFLFQIKILIFLSFSFLQAQDSLYLIGTIAGEVTKQIYDVKGVGDVNNDGYDDFMVTYYFNRYVELYFGSSKLNLTPDKILNSPLDYDAMPYFGLPARIGDVNNDGYEDFTISGTFLGDGYPKGKLFLYYGGETIDTIPKSEFYEPWRMVMMI